MSRTIVNAGPKQVWRRYAGGEMAGDVIAADGEQQDGEPLLAPAMRSGERVGSEPLERIGERAAAQLAALPSRLRRLQSDDGPADPYPVAYSSRLRGT